MTPRRLSVCVLLLGAVLSATPAAAHPFGPPPTARISAQGRTITVDWSATPDDAVAIGERLGVMPAGSIAAYRQESAAQVAPSSQDEARLSASPLLAQYLAEHITAQQDGAPCTPQIDPIPDFVHAGARVDLVCPEPVEQAVLRITMLHALHPQYRTVAVGTRTDPAQSVFTATAPEHEWRFGVEPGGPLGLGGLLAIGLGGGIVAAGATLAVQRSRRARQGEAAEPSK